MIKGLHPQALTGIGKIEKIELELRKMGKIIRGWVKKFTEERKKTVLKNKGYTRTRKIACR